MKRKLSIDIETYSSIDITTAGSYKYFESPDFEILMIAYAFDDEPVSIIDLTKEDFPFWLQSALKDPLVDKYAHNANFERNAFRVYGIYTPIEQWYCSAVKAGYCGLPLSLDGVSKALGLGADGKSAEGKALIKYFSCPVKPTKTNDFRTRNLPHHDPVKWEAFKNYCKQDVEAERNVSKQLSKYTITNEERKHYVLDQEINDRGILIDLDFAANAHAMAEEFKAEVLVKLKHLTGLENPNSPKQLKDWLTLQTGETVTSIAKGSVLELLDGKILPLVEEVLKLRQTAAKSSNAKYPTMLDCAGADSRARGLFQFYGANRTGRWAGRLIQMQNLPQNHLKYLEQARAAVASGDYELVTMLYDNIASVVSQLIRTAFVAKEGHTFAVADFSAIEARVIAWLSGETWRLKVFNTHGKIYEASASKMFNVPIEIVTKASDYRAKGKVAELALGYQGAVGALKTMGGEAMGLDESEMDAIVKKWRKANPAIVQLWGDLESCAVQALKTRKAVKSQHKGLVFDYDGEVLTIELPSGRKLFYQSPSFTKNKWDKLSIRYKGMNQETKQWGYVDTYGGKITENVVQAIARDLLADAMQRVNAAGYDIVLTIHDEIVCEIEKENAFKQMESICDVMAQTKSIYSGVPFPADVFLSWHYKKD